MIWVGLLVLGDLGRFAGPRWLVAEVKSSHRFSAESDELHGQLALMP